MKKIIFSAFAFYIAFNFPINAQSEEIYQIRDEIIAKETLRISTISPDNHLELAELYASRGESYLLNSQFDKAIEDFKSANTHIGYNNIEQDMILAFRLALGEAVCYDNLGNQELAFQAIEQLQMIINHVGCDDCLEKNPCPENDSSSRNNLLYNDLTSFAVNSFHYQNFVSTCKHKKQSQQNLAPNTNLSDDYSDILGPISPPPNWCKEVVVGVTTSMQVIASLAPNWIVKSALVGVLESLKQRALTCCEAGDFWKACVAPITRKWRLWNSHKKNGLLPTEENMHLYLN